MKTVAAVRRELDLDAYKRRTASESDFSTLINESALIYEDGRLMIAYIELHEVDEYRPIFDSLFSALQRVDVPTTARTGGMPSTSKVFGFLPRNTIRRDFCTSASMAVEYPEEHRILTSLARIAGQHYRAVHPDLYFKHKEIADSKVLPEYRLEEDVFTSGILNKDNPLKYHFDAGNFKDVWSCMFGLKYNVSGGYLSVPEYDMGFEIHDRSLLMFDGQGLLHGVTPIRKLSPDAVRYTMVFYSMEQMWNCDPLDEEIVRIRRLRTQRELKRAGVAS